MKEDGSYGKLYSLLQTCKRFDANGDGKISLAEMDEVIRALSSNTVSPDEIKRKMAEIDTDGDGFIDYNEHVAFCRARPDMAKKIASLIL